MAKEKARISDRRRSPVEPWEARMEPRSPRRKHPRPWLILWLWKPLWKSKLHPGGWTVMGRYRTEKARDEALRHHLSQRYQFCQYKATKEAE